MISVIKPKCKCTATGCLTDKRKEAVCGRFETQTHLNQDGKT